MNEIWVFTLIHISYRILYKPLILILILEHQNNKITHKILASFASLNSSIARRALRSRRCLRGRPSQAPAESQVSKRNTRIKRRNFRKDFWGYFDGRSDMKRACFPRPGTSTVRVYKYEKWHFSTFFSSKNDLSTVCKYEKHCIFPVITVFCHN